MNNARRKEIELALDALSEARTRLEDVMNEEQESLDNLPDSLRESDQGEVMEGNVSDLDAAIYSVGDAEGLLHEVKESVTGLPIGESV